MGSFKVTQNRGHFLTLTTYWWWWWWSSSSSSSKTETRRRPLFDDFPRRSCECAELLVGDSELQLPRPPDRLHQQGWQGRRRSGQVLFFPPLLDAAATTTTPFPPAHDEAAQCEAATSHNTCGNQTWAFSQCYPRARHFFGCRSSWLFRNIINKTTVCLRVAAFFPPNAMNDICDFMSLASPSLQKAASARNNAMQCLSSQEEVQVQGTKHEPRGERAPRTLLLYLKPC